MTNQFCTIVVSMPGDEASMEAVHQALKLLEPHKTAMSLDDEMTKLELIEQHPDFQPHVSENARQQAAELHRKAAAAT